MAAYPDDGTVWKVPPGIANSAGTLVLHLCGNLRHFVGAVLGGTGYVRDRDLEFSRRDVTRGELTKELAAAQSDVAKTFSQLDQAALDRPYPQPVGGATVDTADFLVHLIAHLGYHLGQVDYHRRLVTGSNTTVGTVAPKELASVGQPGRVL